MQVEFDPLFGALGNDGWFPSPSHLMRRAAILEMFGGYPGGRLLEMGCGAGRMLVDWHHLGHAGEAVDLDPVARRMAAKCVSCFQARFTVADRVDDRDFDYLVATEVLEHVEDPRTLLAQWVGHLKEGGIFLATVPAYRRLWGQSDEWAGHVQRFEPEDFRKLVEDAGLEVLDMRLYGYPIGNLLRIAGNVASGIKMRRRGQRIDREAATFASGHERSIEKRLAPLLRSLPGRMTLKAAIAIQRYANRGHGLILVARKPASAKTRSFVCAA